MILYINIRPFAQQSNKQIRNTKSTHPHPLQYLDQVRVQSVLSTADLLHVPLEVLD